MTESLQLPPLSSSVAPESPSIRDLLFNKLAWILFNSRTGKVLKCSPSAEMIFGFGCEEMIGVYAEELMPPHRRANHPRYREQFTNDTHDRSMLGGEVLDGIKKDGTPIKVQIDLWKFREPYHADYCLATVRDLTDLMSKSVTIAERHG